MAHPTLGMMTYSFHGMLTRREIDVPGVVRFCASLGVQDLDLTDRHWLDPDRDVLATVEALEETGMGVACCNTSLDLVSRGADAAATRQEQLRELFDRLAQIKCRAVMLGSVPNGLGPAEWREQFGIGMAEAVPLAEEYGMTVTFENRGGPAGEFIGTVEHFEHILDAASEPRLQITFDVGNFRYVGMDSDEAFDRLVDHVAHVHLKDVVPRGESFQMMPLGEGDVDNAPTIRKLAERGYEGCLSIECGGLGSDLEDARKSVEFVQQVLNA